MKKKTGTKIGTKDNPIEEKPEPQGGVEKAPVPVTPAPREPTTEEVLAWVVTAQGETAKKLKEIGESLTNFRSNLEIHDRALSRLMDPGTGDPGTQGAAKPGIGGIGAMLQDPKTIEMIGKVLKSFLGGEEKKEDTEEKKVTTQIVQQSLRRLTAIADREELRNQAIRDGFLE